MSPFLSAARCATRLGAAGLVLAAGLALPAASAFAADESPAARLRLDLRDCREGRSSQSLADCEREARNAAGEARRGRLATPVDAAGQAHRRCAVFKHEGDHADCLARQGAGAHSSGSVAGGGVLRELTSPVLPR